jgi:carbon storage regulator
MLVLTRRTDESLIIGENIVITILAIEGEKVKIGINAPREVPILRKELWQAIQEQNQIAEKLAAETEPDHFEELRKFLAEETKSEEESIKP